METEFKTKAVSNFYDMSLGGMFVIRCRHVEPKSVTCQIQAQLQAFSSLGLPPTSQVL